jgi:hypothetical protein
MITKSGDDSRISGHNHYVKSTDQVLSAQSTTMQQHSEALFQQKYMTAQGGFGKSLCGGLVSRSSDADSLQRWKVGV